jgi:hypothetical protein
MLLLKNCNVMGDLALATKVKFVSEYCQWTISKRAGNTSIRQQSSAAGSALHPWHV